MFPDLCGFLNLVADPTAGVNISQKQRVYQRRLAQTGLSNDENNKIETFPQRFSIDLVWEGGEANCETRLVTEIVSVLSLLTGLIVSQCFFINVIHQLQFLLHTLLSKTEVEIVRGLFSPIFQSMGRKSCF